MGFAKQSFSTADKALYSFKRRLLKVETFFMYVYIYLRYIWCWLCVLSPELHIFTLLGSLGHWILHKTIGWRLITVHDLAVLEISSSRVRYNFARTVAMLWFIVNRSGLFLVAGALIFLSVKMESAIRWIPKSESKIAAGQWTPWATLALGSAVALVSRLRKGARYNKKELLLHDIDATDEEAAKIQRMFKELQLDGWNLPGYMASHLYFEWVDLKYWWNHTLAASELELQKEDELENRKKKSRRDENHLRKPDEEKSFENIDEIPQGFLRELSTMPPKHPAEEYDYEQDEELQRLLHDDEYEKGKTEKARQRLLYKEIKKSSGGSPMKTMSRK